LPMLPKVSLLSLLVCPVLFVTCVSRLPEAIKLLEASRSCQRFQKIIRTAEGSQRLPEVSRNSQMLPEAFQKFQALVRTATSFQRLPQAARISRDS